MCIRNNLNSTSLWKINQVGNCKTMRPSSFPSRCLHLTSASTIIFAVSFVSWNLLKFLLLCVVEDCTYSHWSKNLSSGTLSSIWSLGLRLHSCLGETVTSHIVQGKTRMLWDLPFWDAHLMRVLNFECFTSKESKFERQWLHRKAYGQTPHHDFYCKIVFVLVESCRQFNKNS